MPPSDPSSPGFPSTRWSQVQKTRDPSTRVRRHALGEIVRRYDAPLRSYLILSKGLGRERAEELLQAFVAAKLVEQSLAAQAREEKGKFRTFLLRALDRFVYNALRDERALKRGAGRNEPLEWATEQRDPSPGPDERFAADWAREVLRQAVALMRGECEHGDRRRVWVVFEARVLGPALSGAEPVGYEQLSPELGFASAAEASNALMTAKRMFSRCLRTVVGQYLSDGAAVDAEILELRQTLSVARRDRA